MPSKGCSKNQMKSPLKISKAKQRFFMSSEKHNTSIKVLHEFGKAREKNVFTDNFDPTGFRILESPSKSYTNLSSKSNFSIQI